MYFFTADEHYGHANIIRYCKRPFRTVDEMDAELIRRHNEAVGADDVVVHAGDFALGKISRAQAYVPLLHGRHIFLRGSHDRWLPEPSVQIWEHTIDGQHVVVCHYALRVWPRSHYGSWQLFGHSHGHLPPIGKQWDVGVDNNDFRPLSFERIREIMKDRPENPNLAKGRDAESEE
jgi:calcineurin-like phosphoesterase family protein